MTALVSSRNRSVLPCRRPPPKTILLRSDIGYLDVRLSKLTYQLRVVLSVHPQLNVGENANRILNSQELDIVLALKLVREPREGKRAESCVFG
jgi:hypothetical protein